MAANKKTIKGLTVEHNGKTIENIISLYIDTYEEGKATIGFSYLANQNTTINVHCDLKDVKINMV